MYTFVQYVLLFHKPNDSYSETALQGGFDDGLIEEKLLFMLFDISVGHESAQNAYRKLIADSDAITGSVIERSLCVTIHRNAILQLYYIEVHVSLYKQFCADNYNTMLVCFISNFIVCFLFCPKIFCLQYGQE